MERIFREVEKEILKERTEEDDKRRSYQLSSKEMKRLANISYEGKPHRSLQEILGAVKELVEEKGDKEEVKVSAAMRENLIHRIHKIVQLIFSNRSSAYYSQQK